MFSELVTRVTMCFFDMRMWVHGSKWRSSQSSEMNWSWSNTYDSLWVCFLVQQCWTKIEPGWARGTVPWSKGWVGRPPMCSFLLIFIVYIAAYKYSPHTCGTLLVEIKLHISLGVIPIYSRIQWWNLCNSDHQHTQL